MEKSFELESPNNYLIDVDYPYCLLYNPRQTMGGLVKNQQGLRSAQRFFACQLGVTVLIAVLAALVSGRMAALSAMMGGMSSALPNAYFARKLFRYQGARAARQIVNNLYKGEVLKIILSIILFALVFAFFKVVPFAFFAAYIMAQMIFWFAPLIFVNKQNRPESD
ncbi:F0F1 ATP synthase subunit I [Legionella oakridgensis]|uniref:F0F1 ATP synthase subunit I n=1 Tax=Legionella oakridgensis TaxID=29423 RepID=UPI0003DE6A40|nr:F0F1 ATP synthase subunit I [Legionella oakridgensis]ETO92098.1 F0F1-type ATP synthase, subunit I [Legionella oakridgensis RV-2-2007]